MNDNLVAPLIVGIAIVCLAMVLWVNAVNAAQAEQERREKIYAKYGRSQLAENLIEKVIWVGETSDQLLDSLGAPLDVDQKILKTKKKEVWKYNQTGTNRYALKITLDNDVVVGWDQK